MSTAYGVLVYGDAKSLITTLDQEELFGLAQQFFSDYNAQFRENVELLVERTVEDYTLFYHLPGAGRMQRRGGQAQSHAVKALGSWSVGLPLEEFGDQVAATEKTIARMTLELLQITLDTIKERDLAERKFQLLKAILNNTSWTFTDDDYGNITVYPLANGDSVIYPPPKGTDTEATANAYAGSNFATASISDTNNPIALIVTYLTGRFGVQQGGSNIVVFINSAEKAKVEALSDFTELPDRYIIPGVNVSRLTGLPNVPGNIIGRCSGAWVSEWLDMPATYMFGTHLGQKPPLLERVPEARFGGVGGLRLFATSVGKGPDSANYPWNQAHYEDVFGYGAGNRLNGYVLQLVASTSYTIPTAYV